MEMPISGAKLQHENKGRGLEIGPALVHASIKRNPHVRLFTSELNL
jgi:hypothetical protein